MKLILALAAFVATATPFARAQEGPQPAAQGSLRLLGPSTAAPAEAPPAAPTAVAAPALVAEPVAVPAAPPAAVAETPAAEPVQVAAAPAPAAPAAAAATGWTGAINFSPVAVADLLSRVCRASVSGEGADLSSRAVHLGLGVGQPAPEGLSRVLPPGAVAWRVPTVDGVVFLFGYGEEPLNCGVAVVRPLSEESFNKVSGLLQTSEFGFAPESSQVLQGDVRWTRFKSSKGEFIDMMEYPTKDETPGVLRADFLPG